MKQRQKPVVGAVYGVYVEELKKYGAYQILEVLKGSVCYITLDYLESEPPGEEILPDLQPFYQERFRYHHALNMMYNGGDKWGYGIEYLSEMDWRQGDAKQKENYKKYINGGEWVNLSKGSFRKNEPVLTTALYEAVEHNFSIELFPCVTKVEIEGPNPGIIYNLEALEKLAFLRELIISDLFGFSAEDMKVLERISGLRGLDFYSVPKEAGMAIKKTWKGKLDYLEVKRLRSDDWLKENLENPFRDWDASEFVPVAAYKKTMQQYKKTKKQLEQLYEQFLKDKNLIDLDEFLDVLDEIRDEW